MILGIVFATGGETFGVRVRCAHCGKNVTTYPHRKRLRWHLLPAPNFNRRVCPGSRVTLPPTDRRTGE